jgi:hypothetical protein
MQLRYISIPHLIAEAGGDPWVINKSLQAGRPAQISVLAQAFHDAGRCVAESDAAFDEARRRVEASWIADNGDQPINDSAEVQRVTKSLGLQSLQLPKISVDLENIAAALVQAQRTGAALVSTLEAELQQIDNEVGQAMDLEKDVHLTAADNSALDALISALEQGAVDDTKSALAQLHSLRSGYSDYLQNALTRLRTDGYDPAMLLAVDAPESPKTGELVQIPPPEASAEDINRWWKSLSQEQKDRLIAQHPADLGNLNGIPADVRSPINEAVMNDDLHRVEDTAKHNGASVNDVLRDPDKYGLSATAITRYNNACRTRDGLGASAGSKDPPGPPEVFLLRYQPEAFGGEGAAAIALGNPDTAVNTAVLVKGLGSAVGVGMLSNPDGVRLYQEVARADSGKQAAVVMWVGYDAPDTVFDPGLYEPNMARTGGQLLAADVNALAVTHQGASGDAVTWSPGHVREPGLIGPSLGGLGDDPAVDGFGSTRFKAEVPGYTADPIYDHSHYFDESSESLFSISDVVSGHGAALEHDGMTAHHRGEYLMGEGFDPEALRPATTGHRHSGRTG